MLAQHQEEEQPQSCSEFGQDTICTKSPKELLLYGLHQPTPVLLTWGSNSQALHGIWHSMKLENQHPEVTGRRGDLMAVIYSATQAILGLWNMSDWLTGWLIKRLIDIPKTGRVKTRVIVQLCSMHTCMHVCTCCSVQHTHSHSHILIHRRGEGSREGKEGKREGGEERREIEEREKETEKEREFTPDVYISRNLQKTFEQIPPSLLGKAMPGFRKLTCPWFSDSLGTAEGIIWDPPPQITFLSWDGKANPLPPTWAPALLRALPNISLSGICCTVSHQISFALLKTSCILAFLLHAWLWYLWVLLPLIPFFFNPFKFQSPHV